MNVRESGRPPHLLVALREGRVGGAERLVLESLPTLRDAFEVSITTTPLPGERAPPLTPDDLRSPLRLVLGRADVVYTHLFLPGLLARIGRALGSRARWVHALHFDDYSALPLGGMRAWLDRRWVHPAADRLVAVSSRVAEASAGPGGVLPGGVEVLENALDLSAAEAPSPRASSAPWRIGTVAMLRREKGVDDLVRALAVLVDRGVDAELRVAGEGPERPRLEQLVDELGLGARVTLLGHLSPVDDAYRDLDVYVQPSRAESFGLAALESLRWSLPLVVAPEGNLPACAGGGAYGVVASPDVPRDVALADAVETALADRAGWSARAADGRAHWSARLDPERRRAREVELLRGALRPRVAHVAPIATHADGGGLQRQLLLQTRALDTRGHRLFLLQRPDPDLRAGTGPGVERARLWSHLTRWEVGPETLSGGGSSGRERRLGLRFALAAIPRLWARRQRYDVIHAHQLFSPTLIGAILKTLTGTPLVVRVAASGPGVGEVDQLRRLPLQRLRRWALRRIDVAIALTDAMREELVGAGLPPERVRVVPNAVEIPATSLSQPRRRTGPYTLLYLGRFSEEKDLPTTVRALALAADRGVNVRLRLVGRADPDRDVTEALVQLAAEVGVADRLEWVGYTTDAASERAGADALILPSRSEGMSNALLEAAAAGMVCVASDIPQNRAVTGDDGARYFPVGDTAALAEVLRELADDRAAGGPLAIRTADAARARVARRNAPERVAAAVAAIYAEVTGAPERAVEAGATGGLTGGREGP